MAVAMGPVPGTHRQRSLLWPFTHVPNRSTVELGWFGHD